MARMIFHFRNEINSPLWPGILRGNIPTKPASNEIHSDIHNNYCRQQNAK
jgi:hypothetical protein